MRGTNNSPHRKAAFPAAFSFCRDLLYLRLGNIETFTTNQITTEDDYHRTGERLAPCPVPPSEGEALSRIFHSPSEGAQMGHRPENACSRVSISNRPYTPSEGETLSRIFHSPSEGAHFTHSSGIAIFAARNIETFTTNQITTEDDYHRTGERLASAYRYAGEVSLTSLRRRSR